MFKTERVIKTSLPPPNELTLTWNTAVNFEDTKTIEVGGYKYQIMGVEYLIGDWDNHGCGGRTEVNLELIYEVQQ